MGRLTEFIRDVLSGELGKRAIPPLDGGWTPNDRLDGFAPLVHDLDKARDLVPDGAGGVIIAHADRVSRADPAGALTEIRRFEGAVSALARLPDGGIAVALDEGGLCSLSAQGSIVDSVTDANGTPLRGINALAAGRTGEIFFTVGSTRHLGDDWIRDLMEKNRLGKVGCWEPGVGVRWLLDGLAYPAGLALADGEPATLAVTESWAHRLTKYRWDGRSLVEPMVILDNMPGYPARLASASGGGYWLAVFARRTQLVELILGEKRFREDMMRSLEPALWIRPALVATGSHLEPLQMGGMKTLGQHKPWAPPRAYGLVARIDAEGRVIDSIHSRNGGLYHGIVTACEHDSHLFVLSAGHGAVLSDELEDDE